jgi:hypothetical protein
MLGGTGMGRVRRSAALRLSWVPCALVLLGVGLPRSAGASAPPVRLSLSDCRELDGAEVERLFKAELDVGVPPANDQDVTEVHILCSGARASVKVLDPLSRKTVERSFELSLFRGEARHRLVALGAAELVLASWAELSTNPRPRAEPEGKPPSEEARSSARRTVGARLKPAGSELAVTNLDSYPAVVPKPQPVGKAPAPQAASPANERPYFAPSRPLAAPEPRRRALPRTRVLALLSMRAFFDSKGWLRGGGVRAGSEPYKFVSWSADALVERGTLLNYEVDSMTLGGWVLAFYRLDPFSFRLGFGLRGGAVNSSPANPDGPAGRSSAAPWGWPLAASTITVHAGPVAIDLSGEAGYAVLPLRGGAHPALEGSWYSMQLGIGFLFPTSDPAAGAAPVNAVAGVEASETP